MGFNQFLKSVNAFLTDLQARKCTGEFTVGMEIQAGKPQRGEQRFHERNVLRSLPSEFDGVTMLLNMCYTEAQQMDTRFYGRIEIRCELFSGTVVDTEKIIKQTLVFQAG